MRVDIGVAFVGVGLIGQKRVRASRGIFQPRCLYDLDESRARGVASQFGLDEARSLEQVLDRPDVELVIVATRHNELSPIALRCLEAGKHVLIEKPGGIAAAELRQLTQTASNRGKIVQVGYNHRFHPSVSRARDLIAERAFGNVLWVRGRYGHGGRIGYEKEWRTNPRESGGGELIDQGSHLIDLVRFLIGEVDLVFSHLPTVYWPTQVEDNAFLALRPHAGGMAWLHASWTEWKNLFNLEICFQRAKLDLHGLGGSYGTERLTLYEMSPEMGPPATTSWEWPFEDASWASELNDLSAKICGEFSRGASTEDATRVLEIIGEAYSK